MNEWIFDTEQKMFLLYRAGDYFQLLEPIAAFRVKQMNPNEVLNTIMTYDKLYFGEPNQA